MRCLNSNNFVPWDAPKFRSKLLIWKWFFSVYVTQAIVFFSTLLNFALSKRKNLRTLDKREISASERFLPERLIVLSLTNFPCNLSAAVLFLLPLSCFFSISGVFSVVRIVSFSLPQAWQNQKPQTHPG